MSSSGNANTAVGGEWIEANVTRVPTAYATSGIANCYMFDTPQYAWYTAHGEVAAKATRLGFEKNDKVSIYVESSGPEPHIVKDVREVVPTVIPGVVGISPAAA